MNIFILSDSVRESVRYHCDQHVRKMPTEAAQMLSTCIYLQLYEGMIPRGSPPELKASYKAKTGIYLPTHANHPVSKWVRSSRDNFIYTLAYSELLCDEFTYRFNKVHGTLRTINAIKGYLRYLKFPRDKLTAHVITTDKNRVYLDPVREYQRYYKDSKRGWYDGYGNWHDNTWTNRPTPEFMNRS